MKNLVSIASLVSVASLSLLLPAGSATAPPKPEIVLVHGAWEEANIWQAVTPLLKKDGYRVVTVTLPGRPSSPLSPDKVSLDLGNSDQDSKIGPHLQILKDKGIVTVEKSARADLFGLDGNDQLRAEIPNLIVDEPLAPLATPVHLTADRFGTVDKVYIHTAKDQVVSPSLQAIMVAATPVRKEITIDTGHTPFLIDPRGMARDIEMAANPQKTASH